jgi:hypothetical protein
MSLTSIALTILGGLVGGLILTLLTLILSRLDSLSRKLDLTVTESTCTERRVSCPRLQTIESVREDFDRHTHDGLDRNARVIVNQGAAR